MRDRKGTYKNTNMKERGMTPSKLRSLMNHVIKVPASHHLLKPPVSRVVVNNQNQQRYSLILRDTFKTNATNFYLTYILLPESPQIFNQLITLSIDETIPDFATLDPHIKTGSTNPGPRMQADEIESSRSTTARLINAILANIEYAVLRQS